MSEVVLVIYGLACFIAGFLVGRYPVEWAVDVIRETCRGNRAR